MILGNQQIISKDAIGEVTECTDKMVRMAEKLYFSDISAPLVNMSADDGTVPEITT